MVKCVRLIAPEPLPEPIIPKPQVNKELRKIIVRRLKAPSPEYDPDHNSVLLLLAPEIIEFVTDFFTLINLSRTCKTLHKVIRRRPAIRDALFDVIEHYDTEPPELAACRHYDTSFVCRFILNEPTARAYWSTTWNDRSHRTELDVRLNHTTLVNAGGFSFLDILDAAVLPCYSCKRIKSHGEFFEHYATGHLTLMGCLAKRRKCIDCVFADPVPEDDVHVETDHYPWQGWTSDDRSKFGDLKVYLIDMPKRIPGFRQHCQVCSATSWARKRPRKTLEIAKVCKDCLHKGPPRAASPNSRRKSMTPKTEESQSTDKKDDDLQDSRNLGFGLVDQFPRYNQRRLSGSRFELLAEELSF